METERNEAERNEEEYNRSILVNDFASYTREKSVEVLKETLSMVHKDTPALMKGLGEDLGELGEANSEYHVLVKILDSTADVLTIDDNVDEDVLKAFNIMKEEFLQMHHMTESIMSKESFKDMLSYYIYDTDIEDVEKLKSEILNENTLTPIEQVELLSQMFSGVTSNTEDFAIDKDTLVMLFRGCEEVRPGTLVEVIDLYLENPMIKNKDLLDVYKNKIAELPLEELGEEFVELLSGDSNTAAMLLVTRLIHTIKENNENPNMEEINVNGLRLDSLISTMQDRFLAEGDDEDVEAVNKRLVNYILPLLTRV